MRSSLVAALLLSAAPLFVAHPALAQRVDDNVVRSASDAFGASVGNENIGLYSAYDVRGFSAVDAGNVRLDGLYFDRQADVSNLLSPSSTIRVGISAQGYPLPAPTGIADYDLVRADDRRVLSLIGTYGPYGGSSLELDAKTPLIAGRLGLAVGGAYGHSHYEDGVSRSDSAFTAALQWRPTDKIEVIPFYSFTQNTNVEASPAIFVGGPWLPPRIKRARFWGQPWADNTYVGVNYGLVASADLGQGWRLKGGLFQSEFQAKTPFADLFVDADAAGRATHLIVADPDQDFSSTSGELRLSKTFEAAGARHTLHLMLRGRSGERRYGGSDVVDLGDAEIGQPVVLPKPTFNFGPQVLDEIRQGTVAAAYQGQFGRRVELSAGIQKTDYRKRETLPGGPPVELQDSPWLYNLAAAYHASDRLAFYAGYTTGLEEAGVAPPNAVNKDSAPPAIHTRQWEAGLRYAFTPDLKLVAGLFDIRKPYTNLDAANLFRSLGEERHQGIELSLAGKLAPGLNVVAGTVLQQPTVVGEEVDAGLIGKHPVGQTKRTTIVAFDYQTSFNKNLSFNALIQSIAERMASSDNRLAIPDRSTLDLGARYRFKIGPAPASLRVTVGNVFDTFGWRTNASGVFVTNGPRRLLVSLTADF